MGLTLPVSSCKTFQILRLFRPLAFTQLLFLTRVLFPSPLPPGGVGEAVLAFVWTQHTSNFLCRDVTRPCTVSRAVVRFAPSATVLSIAIRRFLLEHDDFFAHCVKEVSVVGNQYCSAREGAEDRLRIRFSRGNVDNTLRHALYGLYWTSCGVTYRIKHALALLEHVRYLGHKGVIDLWRLGSAGFGDPAPRKASRPFLSGREVSLGLENMLAGLF